MDVAVEEATKQRKAESAASNKALAESGAAKELLQMAKDRMNKFYNPKLAPKDSKPKLLQEDDDNEAPAFVQVKAHSSFSDDMSSSLESAESDDESKAAEKNGNEDEENKESDASGKER